MPCPATEPGGQLLSEPLIPSVVKSGQAGRREVSRGCCVYLGHVGLDFPHFGGKKKYNCISDGYKVIIEEIFLES